MERELYHVVCIDKFGCPIIHISSFSIKECEDFIDNLIREWGQERVESLKYAVELTFLNEYQIPDYPIAEYLGNATMH